MADGVFNPPPGWPTPPAGWVPPPGWRPPSSWPAPPPGWQLWVSSTAGELRTVADQARYALRPTTAPGPARETAQRAAADVGAAGRAAVDSATAGRSAAVRATARRTAAESATAVRAAADRASQQHDGAALLAQARDAAWSGDVPRVVMPEPFTTGHERRRRRGSTTATPLEQPDYVTRAITYPPAVPGDVGTVGARSTRHDAALRSARSSGLRLLWLGVVLAVVGVVLYATASPLTTGPGQLLLSWVLMALGAIQLLRGFGRWAKAAVSMAALPDPW